MDTSNMSLMQTDFTEAPPAPPNVMIIFGAGGDLTKRKLIPSLFHLCAARLLPESFVMLGLDRLELHAGNDRAGVLRAERPRDHPVGAE